MFQVIRGKQEYYIIRKLPSRPYLYLIYFFPHKLGRCNRFIHCCKKLSHTTFEQHRKNLVVLLFFVDYIFQGISILLPRELVIMLLKYNFRISGNSSICSNMGQSYYLCFLFLLHSSNIYVFSCPSLALAIPFSLKNFHGGN